MQPCGKKSMDNLNGDHIRQERLCSSCQTQLEKKKKNKNKKKDKTKQGMKTKQSKARMRNTRGKPMNSIH